MIPEDYQYGAHDGKTYTGNAAYILNHLDSAACALEENFRDVRADPIFDDNDVFEEAELRSHILWLLDHAADLAAYL